MIRDNVLLAWAAFVLLVAVYVYALAPIHIGCEYIDTTEESQ
jgi:hypothetical protein